VLRGVCVFRVVLFFSWTKGAAVVGKRKQRDVSVLRIEMLSEVLPMVVEAREHVGLIAAVDRVDAAHRDAASRRLLLIEDWIKRQLREVDAGDGLGTTQAKAWTPTKDD
jgi:oligoribonuclease (3'-5' exoribonuclease)